MTDPNSTRTECVLCPNETGEKITREHIYGDWMSDVLPEPERSRTGFLAVRDPVTGEVTEHEFTEPEYRHQTKLRALCETCNTVWGSQIETAAKRILTPMIQGKSRWVTNAEATTLGQWAMKVAMLRELFDPYQVMTTAQRHEFRRTSKPPGTHLIFLARIHGISGWSGRTRHLFTFVPGPDGLIGDVGDKPNMHIVTSGFGAVVFFVVGNSAGLPMLDLGAMHPTAVIRLWPEPYSFAWPTEESLDSATIENASGTDLRVFFGDQLDPFVEKLPRPTRFTT